MKAATLAVGTEVTDGQILDRNSAWLSQKLVNAGIAVVEHRAVADDAAEISRALSELAARVDLLFITGGLGPTSDDFTRNIIADVFKRSLVFDPGSWQHIESQLSARGIAAREIQKQQCYFPVGSRVLKNTAGTANAFSFVTEKGLCVYALPGPPGEIAAVWDMHLDSEVAALIPETEREKLKIIRCLGQGESTVAEIVEAVLADSGLRVGYRAHAPYVEVKIWYRVRDQLAAQPFIEQIETKLAAWLVNRDDEDVADSLIDFALTEPVRILDRATRGVIGDRLIARAKQRGSIEGFKNLTIETSIGCLDGEPSRNEASRELVLEIDSDSAAGSWRISLRLGEGVKTDTTEKPPFNYQVLSERGCKFITEKAFLAAQRFLSESELM